MIRKIPIEELRLGMQINRFDCGWLEHPFIFSRPRIKSEAEIERIRSWGITHVFIEEEPLKQPPPPPRQEPEPAPLPVPKPVHKDQEILHVPLQHEIARAREIRTKAIKAAHSILDSVRTTGKIPVAEAYETVAEMDSSVQHNRDALFLLMRLRKKDEYTFDHSVSVGMLLLAFARSMGFDGETSRSIGLGGFLHDVGKMAVPLSILNKPARLTDEEFKKIQRHPQFGREILSRAHIQPAIVRIATEHHERFNGTGYPSGLIGGEISQGGQMAAIADVFDALTSDRCYHNGKEQVEVLRTLYGWSKVHFNQELVQYFIRCVGIYPVGTLVRLQSGLIGVVAESTDNLLRPVVRVVYDTKRDWAVPQKDLDLSKGGADRIVGYESVQQWRINPLKVLDIG